MTEAAPASFRALLRQGEVRGPGPPPAVSFQRLPQLTRGDVAAGFDFELPGAALAVALQDERGATACFEDVTLLGGGRVRVAPGVRVQRGPGRCEPGPDDWLPAHVTWRRDSTKTLP